ncbi:MAG TPA: protein-disulfide reductase DsbD domain-containing protein [Thermoanaerobaculia bacterium]
MTAPKLALLPFAALLLSGPSLAWGAASEWSTNPQSSVRLITPWLTAPRSGEVILGLQFRLSPGWHVYWKNSGDAGFPPTATFQPAALLGTPEILWPTPSRFDLPGGLVAFGYEGEVVYPVRAEIKPATAAPQDSFHITADLDYLVCQIDCVPFRYTLALDQPVGDKPVADPATVTTLQSWVERLPRIVREVPGVRTGAVLDASRPSAFDLEVRVLGATATAGRTDLFLESHDTFDAGRPRMKPVAGGVVFHVPMKPKEANRALPAKTSIAWTVSNLTAKDGKPFSLEARREIQVWTDAGGARPDPMREVSPSSTRGTTGFPRLLLWAFLGGALMNLAPAVLALLAGEVLALRAPGSGAREGAAAVVTGVVGGCWAVAGFALLARREGWAADWAALLREPAVGALFVVAAAAFALNLWGLLEIPLAPAGAAGATRADTGRHLLAGLFAVPLALAWPVPLLREPIAFAFARDPAAVCAVFAVIGFGLALPYLLLTLAPLRARAAAPWLPRLREGLGFLAGGSALWLLYRLSREVSPEGLATIELALLAMGLFAWLRARQGTGWPARLVLILALAACAAGALWLADHNRSIPRVAATADLTTRQHTSGG